MPNKFLTWLSDERDRWVLWLPVGIGLGAAVYFALESEPSFWIPAIVLLPGLLAGARSVSLRRVGVAWLAVSVGFAAAWLHTHAIQSPILEREMTIRKIHGIVREIEISDTGSRVTLDHPVIERLSPENTPERIRVTLRNATPQFGAGDSISLLAGLYPPPKPSSPGSFDFQRYFYFKQIGAVGYGVGEVSVNHAATPSTSRHYINTLRQGITSSLRAALPGAEGAVAAALITGDTRAIPETLNDTMRVAGLYHLLAVSGMNLAIVAGILFFSVRLVLVLIPGLALRYPVKKWAALIALIGSYGYLLIAGEPVSAERAFIMAALVLIAVLLDRAALTMRSLAWAAVVVLLIEPAAVIAPGFQLSFAATIALVSLFEQGRDTFSEWKEGAGFIRRTLLYLTITGLTTLAAGLATAPFAIYHFNRFSNYSLLANLLVIPLVSFWIMPLLVLLVLLLPLGIIWPLAPLISYGISLMIHSAEAIAGLPYAAITVSSPTGYGLAVIALGGLWYVIWSARIRYAGLVAMVLGMATMVANPPPDIYVNGNARQVAVRDANNQLVLARGQARGLVGESWLERNGQKRFLKPAEAAFDKQTFLRCDRQGCIYGKHDNTVAIVNDRDALAEECGSTVIIALFDTGDSACATVPLVDKSDLSFKGGHALWLGSDRWIIRNVLDEQGFRPWSQQP